jgi:hypothetical protein
MTTKTTFAATVNAVAFACREWQAGRLSTQGLRVAVGPYIDADKLLDRITDRTTADDLRRIVAALV